MKKAVLVSGARTPIGSFLGSLSALSAPKLGAIAIEGAVKKTGLLGDAIDEVIMGQVLQGGCGQAPARQAALLAQLPKKVACTTVNKVCGSGLKAVMMAADAIALGHSKLVVAGGMESMSNAPYILPAARSGFRMGNQSAIDLMIHDGLFDPYGQAHMGIFGDACAKEFGFSRQDQDAYAHESYRRAMASASFFSNEIIPVSIEYKGEKKIVAHDEEPQRYQKDKVATLRPAFDKEGSITAANASKLNDGAAALVVAQEDEAVQRSLPIKARIVAFSTYADEPAWFTTAPIMAIKNVVQKAQLSLQDIDLFEINEAFSVVPLVAMKQLGLPAERVNAFGGAVALGHPIGCSGARVLVTLLYGLEQNNKRFGCASLCLGGGEAVAMIIERV